MGNKRWSKKSMNGSHLKIEREVVQKKKHGTRRCRKQWQSKICKKIGKTEKSGRREARDGDTCKKNCFI